MTSVEKSNNFIAPDSICVSTREASFHFGLFLQAAGEAFDLIRQLANLAMRKLIDENAEAESSVLNRQTFLCTCLENTSVTKSIKSAAHLNREKIKSNLSVPGIQGHHENALIKSFEMSPHLMCL